MNFESPLTKCETTIKKKSPVEYFMNFESVLMLSKKLNTLIQHALGTKEHCVETLTDASKSF